MRANELARRIILNQVDRDGGADAFLPLSLEGGGGGANDAMEGVYADVIARGPSVDACRHAATAYRASPSLDGIIDISLIAMRTARSGVGVPGLSICQELARMLKASRADDEQAALSRVEGAIVLGFLLHGIASTGEAVEVVRQWKPCGRDLVRDAFRFVNRSAITSDGTLVRFLGYLLALLEDIDAWYEFSYRMSEPAGEHCNLDHDGRFSRGTLVYDASVANRNFARSLADIVPGDLSTAAVLDLGCGTGLLMTMLERRCRRAVGVDIDDEMTAHCRRSGLYAEVSTHEAIAYLEQCRDDYDVIMAGNVLQLVLDIGGLIARAARRLVAGGQLAFSFLPTNAPGHRRMVTRDAYLHSLDRVAEQIRSSGMTITSMMFRPLHTGMGCYVRAKRTA